MLTTSFTYLSASFHRSSGVAAAHESDELDRDNDRAVDKTQPVALILWFPRSSSTILCRCLGLVYSILVLCRSLQSQSGSPGTRVDPVSQSACALVSSSSLLIIFLSSPACELTRCVWTCWALYIVDWYLSVVVRRSQVVRCLLGTDSVDSTST